jgi:hypothetical protein
LSNHESPSIPQLGELATANPQAYAIVSALLNKRHQNTLPETERGPDVFLKMMGGPRRSSGARTAVPYDIPVAEAQPAVENQMSYDPKSADDKDEAMVDGLLNAVEGLAGGRGSKKIAMLRKSRRHQDSQQNNLVGDGVFAHPLGSANVAPKPTMAPMSEEEKEQRAAAGLPLTSGTKALLVKSTDITTKGMRATMEIPGEKEQQSPSSYDSLEATALTSTPKQAGAPSALLKFLR